MNHEPGTSMRSSGSAPARRRKNAATVLKARTTLRQLRKKSSSPEVTIMGTPIHRLHEEIFRNVGSAMSPAARKCGARKQKLTTAPSSMLHACRNEMIAPAAMNSSEPSSDIVTWLSISGSPFQEPMRIQLVPQVSWNFGYLSHGAHAGADHSVNSAHFGIHAIGVRSSHDASALRIQAMSPPSPRARNSDFACRAASPPCAWSERSVAAAAVPVGNGSCSMLIICRLVGTARNTPIHEIRITHGISHIIRCAKSCGSRSGFSIMSAGMAFAIPAEVMVPAAEAVDCMALFSRME